MQGKTTTKYKFRITIFTPTYNRAYTIDKLYHSLKEQTFTDFEWLVVDDGSTDNTEELFEAWVKEKNSFEIRYFKTENGGKHRAINKALDLAKGVIFFTVDSDDQLTPDATKKLNDWFKEIESDNRLCGIVANRGYTPHKTVNNLFSSHYLDKTFFDMETYEENGNKVIDGERAIAFYTDYHKMYRFPEFPDERFMTEGVVYCRMAHDGCLMRFYNDIIWIFEYHEDGLTKAGYKLFLMNPRGYGLWLKEKAEFLRYSFFRKVKMYYTFTCDLAPYHDLHIIAESIGAPLPLIWLLNQTHAVIEKIRK